MTPPSPDTRLLIDGHVHLYPGYDLAKAVHCLLNNLSRSTVSGEGRERVVIGLLAESRTCRFYRNLVTGTAVLDQGPLRLSIGPDAGSLTILENNQARGYLIAGRQIVTAEKLEVLALGTDVALDDGLPVEETLSIIRAQGAVPVLSWSPGKWFFGRGKRVKELIERHTPADFLIGDTGLRPTVWPLPGLMRLARRRGYRIIGGSDPLPLPDEEMMIGSYGVTLMAPFVPGQPAESLRRLLADPGRHFTPVGRRSPPLAFLSRWIRNQFRGKKAQTQEA